ncbi:MAG: hypothetical protein FWC80_01900 [Firmicutes bacterium]|nr:hypothetical protein [Bacillota bacterium]
MRILERNVSANCELCKKSILVTEFGSGKCPYCDWVQNNTSETDEDLDVIHYPNPVSFNRAKELLAQGKPLEPNLEEFVIGLEIYAHMEFLYEGRRYGVLGVEHGVDFYEWDVLEGFQEYGSPEEFYQKANIGGVLLKDLWHKVKKANFMDG